MVFSKNNQKQQQSTRNASDELRIILRKQNHPATAGRLYILSIGQTFAVQLMLSPSQLRFESTAFVPLAVL